MAVKVLREVSQGSLASFLQEAKLAQHHEHIVQLLGYCDRPVSLVFEHMDGGSLQNILDTEDRRS